MSPITPTTRPVDRRSPGGRDLCTDLATGRESAWFAARFLEVYNRRCAACHDAFPHPNDHERIWDGRFAWINFTHPEWSPALTAHLSEDAGGRGLATQRFAAEPPLFADTTDPDYVTMLQAIQEGRRQMLAQPREDMREPVTELKHTCSLRHSPLIDRLKADILKEKHHDEDTAH